MKREAAVQQCGFDCCVGCANRTLRMTQLYASGFPAAVPLQQLRFGDALALPPMDGRSALVLSITPASADGELRPAPLRSARTHACAREKTLDFGLRKELGGMSAE
jgi:hypothetical protein